MSNLLANYMDNFFDDMTMSPSYLSRRTTAMPALNIREFDEMYEISLTVPGLKEDDIKLEVIDNTLKISYEHNDETTEKEEGIILIKKV
jgi:HSP20 family molecular chaperone IbpA